MRLTIRYGREGGVLWLDAYAKSQRLSLGGYCRYWKEGQIFGGFSCPDHPEVGSVSYKWDNTRFVRGNLMPTLAGPILEGEWLPDEEWKEIRGKVD